MNNRLLKQVILFVLLFATVCSEGCQKKESSRKASTSRSGNNPQKDTTSDFPADKLHFQFGVVYKVGKPDDFSLRNPHHVAQYSVYLCKEGLTENLIKEIGHIEEDKELGRCFICVIREFGPDMERYKGNPIGLKFVGYKEGKDTSVWYYYLVDDKGDFMDNKSWISLHRSKQNGRCALTGIFLNIEGEKRCEIPDDLLTSQFVGRVEPAKGG